ncbi:hypothetical protein RRG08_055115 [Elysia crispata]|uniref:Uncharacterized protein n=1 Tax=Elysia crispata TaxID=231223 RepID=A0AAE0YM70_9GAST|nr:hypothetical protein RRG08_055115 [Elysia crispata]
MFDPESNSQLSRVKAPVCWVGSALDLIRQPEFLAMLDPGHSRDKVELCNPWYYGDRKLVKLTTDTHGGRSILTFVKTAQALYVTFLS